MKKNLSNFIFIVYIVIAVFVTMCLLCYNEFKVTEFGDYALILVTDDGLVPDFNEGDLVIVNRDDDIFTGRKAFFYDTYNQKIEVRLGTVEAAEKITNTETTYTFEGERKISGQYVVGAANTAEVIPYAGTVLSILESKFGFLFLIVLPALLAFINQITVVFSEIKNAKDE